MTIRKLIIVIAVITGTTSTAFGQCTSLFSFAAYFENVTFINQSTVSNAHYFWNFGDGTGSNLENPVHKFPETGSYLVTLFAKDTISNCNSYYEYWLNLNKYSLDTCQASMTDSIFLGGSNYFLTVNDHSLNCNGYYCDFDGGPGQNFPLGSSIYLGGSLQHGRFVSRVTYYTYDTISGYVVHREAYKSSPFFYTSAKNYGDCSANFEFTVVSEDTGGQRVLFTAMNKTAMQYEWGILGFGPAIHSSNDTISHYYPFNENNLWNVSLLTTGSTGCKDSLQQNIIIGNGIQTTVGINETQNDINYTLLPNPFVDYTLIDFSEFKQKTTFVLFNSTGQIVNTIKNITNGQVLIDRNGMASGLYYFILQTDERIIARGKMIAQ